MDYRKFPKINLHHHLEGAVRPQTFLEIGIKNKIWNEGLELEDILKKIQIDGTERNLVDFLKKVDYIINITKTKEDFIRIMKEIVEDSYEQGVEYLEVRGGPSIHVKEDLFIEDVLEGILEGIEQGQKSTNIKANFIFTALRHENPEKNARLAKLAAKYKKYGVVGFDLAGDETSFPARLHEKAFYIAKQEGLGITVHAGEGTNSDSVRDAVEILKATRIGHGISSIASKETMELLKEEKVLLEVCPTSNLHTKSIESYKHHPLRALFNEGIRISIGDDDPTTSNINISYEYEMLEKQFGFSLEEFIKIQHFSIEASFLSQKEKLSLKEKCDEKIKQLFKIQK